MNMIEVITLIHDDGTKRDVFAGLRSIGQTEFYQARTTDYRPELKFVIADYLDYNDETIIKHGGKFYRVLRTYRAGQELEITVTCASAEEAELYGEDH